MAIIDAVLTVARARSFVGREIRPQGMCLNFVWQRSGALSSIGASVGRMTTAYQSWLASFERHEGDWNAPAGAYVYYGPSPTRWDKNKNAGDIGISIGGGYAIFTDAAGQGARVGIMSLRARAAQISRPYLGWCANLGGHRISFGTLTPASPTPATPIRTDDDEMLTPEAQAWMRKEIRDAINDNTNTNAARVLDGIRRDGRYRVYKNRETGAYKVINWDLPSDDPARVIYPNDEAHLARMFNPYQLVGDTAAQAKVVEPFEFESLGRLADGTDIAYREDKTTPTPAPQPAE